MFSSDPPAARVPERPKGKGADPDRNHRQGPRPWPGMVDPYAPPTEGPVTRTPTYGANAGAQYETSFERPYEGYETPRERRVRREHDRPRDRHEPANPGLFWAIAAIGVGLLCLARLVVFFAIVNTLPGSQVASGFFAVAGAIALSAGLTLAAVLQRGLPIPARIALLLGGGFFAVVGLPNLPAFGFL